MAAIAVAELVVASPLEATFARFIDFSGWDLWMPASVRPISGPARALRAGDSLRIGVGPQGRLESDLRVIRVRPNKELCWSFAGVPWLLRAEHSFFFSEVPGGTRVRSEEPAYGLLTCGLLGQLLEREGTRVAQEILSGLAAQFGSPQKPGRPLQAARAH
jgi:hypothetical protein